MDEMSSNPTVVTGPAGRTEAAPRLPPLILACLAATWLIWGSTYLAIKWALVSFPPFYQMGTRFLVAGALLAAWVTWRGSRWPTRPEWINATILGTLMLGVAYGLTAVAEVSVSSGLVVAFIAIGPALQAAMELPYGIKPAKLECAGIALGLVGVLWLASGQSFSAAPMGLVAVMTASVAWKLGSVWSQRGLPQWLGGRALDLTTPGSPVLEVAFEQTAAFAWLQSRAGEFGFDLSYPPGNPDGFQYEPWHWCYRVS